MRVCNFGGLHDIDIYNSSIFSAEIKSQYTLTLILLHNGIRHVHITSKFHTTQP